VALKECAQHGYFREERCPVCAQAGRFLLNDRELDHLGRVMTGILRHFPEKYGLTLDAHGWISLPELVRAMQGHHRGYHWLRVHHLVGIAESDAKGRYAVKDDRIRATYGHTVEVDLDLPTEPIPSELFFPVTADEAAVVLEVGLKPTDRRHVHLSRTAEAARAAGAVRTPEPVILGIDATRARADGIVIKLAGKTVFLADQIPAGYLRRLTPEETPPAPVESKASQPSTTLDS
jgi:putative RNA 2'-phosphotransferase